MFLIYTLPSNLKESSNDVCHHVYQVHAYSRIHIYFNNLSNSGKYPLTNHMAKKHWQLTINYIDILWQ